MCFCIISFYSFFFQAKFVSSPLSSPFFLYNFAFHLFSMSCNIWPFSILITVVSYLLYHTHKQNSSGAVHENVWFPSLWAWVTSLNIKLHFQNFIFPYNRINFIMYICHIFMVHSSVAGHVGWLEFSIFLFVEAYYTFFKNANQNSPMR